MSNPSRDIDSNKESNSSQSETVKKVETSGQKGSKSDPELTELDGLKKGGVEPKVNPEDKALDNKGRPD